MSGSASFQRLRKSLQAAKRRYAGVGERGKAHERVPANRPSAIEFYFAGASIASSRSGVVSTLSKCG